MIKLILTVSCLFFINSSKGEINFRVWYKKIGNAYEIYADNNEYCNISLKLKFTLKNMSSSIKDGDIIIVPSKKVKYKIATVKPSKSIGKFSFKYEVVYNYGDVTINQFDSDYSYNLPFKKGKKYKVSQGY